jgi:hypothetical protein
LLFHDSWVLGLDLKPGAMHSYLLGSNGLLAGLVKLLDGLLVVTQVLLATDEDDG